VPRRDDRRGLNGTLRSGAPWRDLPDSFGPYTTCNQIKQCRRIVTRYDKLAANYLAFIQLASIRLWLRVNESAPWFERALGRQT
jgi:transposase